MNAIHRYFLHVLVAGLLLLALFSQGLQRVMASPMTRYVAPGGACGGPTPCYSSVQAAVTAASAGDEIRVAAGTYTGVNTLGGFSQSVYIDKSLTIKGGYTTSDWTTTDPVTNSTTISALAQGRVVYINGAYTVTMEGLHLVFGSPATAGSGGGIYIESATVTLRQVWITNNTAPSGQTGGGIFVKNGVLTVENSTIQDNIAGDGGGGIRILNSQATLDDNLIAANKSSSYISIAGGGGVLVGGVSQVTMEGNTIQDNTAGGGSNGGGISVIDSGGSYTGNMNLTLNNNTIQGNEAGSGGGVYIKNYFSDNLYVYATITNNTIQNNYSKMYSGGGISAGATGVTISGNTINDNHGGVEKATGFGNYGNGGGIYASGTAIISNNQIQGNEAVGIGGEGRGGGVYLNGSGSITFEHNTVTGNVAQGATGGRGGGIYATGDNVVIVSNQIQSNSAIGGTNYYGGGGITISEGDMVVYSNVITDNSVSSNVAHGSGISVYGCQPTLVGNTIASNTGGNGDGIFVKASSSAPGQPLIYNTIIALQITGINVDAGSPQNMAAVDGILWWNNTANSSGTVFPSNELTGNPAFVDSATYNYHIGATSSAINAGQNANIPAGLTTDVDNLPRIANGTVDLGADEYDAYYLLEINQIGQGTGLVTSTPAGIDCGSTCSYSFDKDTPVTLSAVPDAGTTFGGWSGNADCTDGAVTMNADRTCNVILYIPGQKTFQSQGTYDGDILESGENTSKGGTVNTTATTFRLGDDPADKQYRAILSFNTATLPDTLVITKVTLKIKRQGVLGTNPFTILGGLRVDIRKPYFGTGIGLAATDFQAAPNKSAVGTFNITPVAYWYSAIIGQIGYPSIHRTGTTQFRLRFAIDDNNDNGADYMKFYSGNYAAASARPTLIIEYYIP